MSYNGPSIIELSRLIRAIDNFEPELVKIIKYYIKTYTFQTKKELNDAVKLLNTNKEKCIETYGHISYWDVSKITDMTKLFKDMTKFNEDISRWNVSSVKNMECMFYGAYSFNQPLNNWDVSNVKYMSNMFKEANSFNQQELSFQ